MTEMLQEYCDCRGVAVRVDRQAGVIRGVKVLGLESRNGRTYLPDALAQAVPLYEDAKVNVNHPKGHPAGPRDYQDRLGAVRNVAVRPGEGLFADLHFNPKHGLAEQLIWDAEHAPENVGFSHNVEARTARRGDRTVVEAITRVQSVDLVADPATTRGLFESRRTEGGPASLEDLKRRWPQLVEELRQEQAGELQRLQAEVQRLTALEADQRKEQAIRRLLREFNLPEPEAADAHARAVTSAAFVESLRAAADEAAMRTLVEERARLVRALGGPGQPAAGGKPVSRDQYLVEGPGALDVKAFIEAIT